MGWTDNSFLYTAGENTVKAPRGCGDCLHRKNCTVKKCRVKIANERALARDRERYAAQKKEKSK